MQGTLISVLFPKEKKMELPVSPAHLAVFSKSLDLLQQVVAQLTKDFQLSGFDVEFSGDETNAYQELTRQIEPLIANMLEFQNERFWTLLYSIDINEKQVREALFGENPNSVQLLTDLILKRELQKVVIRNHYAGRL
jgi:hypothetical protein